MSTDLLLSRVIEQANTLSVDKQLQLIEYLVHNMQNPRQKKSRKQWRDIRGMARYPMMGMDAQEWVSSNRKDENGSRESQWSDNK